VTTTLPIAAGPPPVSDTPSSHNGLIEVTVEQVAKPAPRTGATRITARPDRHRPQEPDDVLVDRFYGDQFPDVVVGPTMVELDHSAAFRRWRPAEFLAWLDAVRPLVADATQRGSETAAG
jgi:hypothetical protein